MVDASSGVCDCALLFLWKSQDTEERAQMVGESIAVVESLRSLFPKHFRVGERRFFSFRGLKIPSHLNSRLFSVVE